MFRPHAIPTNHALHHHSSSMDVYLDNVVWKFSIVKSMVAWCNLKVSTLVATSASTKLSTSACNNQECMWSCLLACLQAYMCYCVHAIMISMHMCIYAFSDVYVCLRANACV